MRPTGSFQSLSSLNEVGSSAKKRPLKTFHPSSKETEDHGETQKEGERPKRKGGRKSGTFILMGRVSAVKRIHGRGEANGTGEEWL